MEDSETPSSDRSHRNSDEAVADCSDPFCWLAAVVGGCLAVGGDWLTDFRDGKGDGSIFTWQATGGLKESFGMEVAGYKKDVGFFVFSDVYDVMV